VQVLGFHVPKQLIAKNVEPFPLIFRANIREQSDELCGLVVLNLATNKSCRIVTFKGFTDIYRQLKQ
jgi:hypothetical protein